MCGIIQINDPEMPARRGGDQTMNNLSRCIGSHGLHPWKNDSYSTPHDPEGCRTI
jgi:hypothetical protein